MALVCNIAQVRVVHFEIPPVTTTMTASTPSCFVALGITFGEADCG